MALQRQSSQNYLCGGDVRAICCPSHGSAQGMSATLKLLDWIGAIVARQLIKPTSGYEPYAAARPELVAMTIRPADVLLVEGPRSKINSAIRYLTQSTWSHSAFYVGLGTGR